MKKTILIFVMAIFVMIANQSVAQQNSGKSQEVKIKTSSVCGMCKDKMEQTFAYEKGIKSAVLDLETKVLTVVFNPKKTNVETICKTVNNLGYDANNSKANPEAYNKFPACCKKTEGEHHNCNQKH